jgi:hypothetical protein
MGIGLVPTVRALIERDEKIAKGESVEDEDEDLSGKPEVVEVVQEEPVVDVFPEGTPSGNMPTFPKGIVETESNEECEL